MAPLTIEAIIAVVISKVTRNNAVSSTTDINILPEINLFGIFARFFLGDFGDGWSHLNIRTRRRVLA